MESHFEKVAKMILSNNSNVDLSTGKASANRTGFTGPDFKDRNRHKPTITEKKLNQLKEKTNKQVESMYKRNQWLEAQRRNNYINEYDRLTGHINSGLKHHTQTIEMLNNRLDKLKKMAKLSVEGEKHPIYIDTGTTEDKPNNHRVQKNK